MKTCLDCIPCFYRQAIEAARHAKLTDEAQKQIVLELSKNVEKFLSGYSPPEIARMVYDIINHYANTKDVYAEIKEQNNEFALRLYPELKERLIKSDYSLLLATEFAIVGNIIDYGAKSNLDINHEVDKILKSSGELLWANDKKIFNLTAFKNKILNSKSILYLADNAGEAVFDKLLIEAIKYHNPIAKIYYAVKEAPIINDALIKDAIQCGVDQIVTVISSGSVFSGTLLSYCNQEFLNLFNSVDLVISKGQGNFEGLHEVEREIYFLFIAKCQTIARMLNTDIGNMILLQKTSK